MSRKVEAADIVPALLVALFFGYVLHQYTELGISLSSIFGVLAGLLLWIYQFLFPFFYRGRWHDEVKKVESRIRSLSESHAATDYSSPESVKAANEAADEIRNSLLALDHSSLSRLLAFEPSRPWVAYFILERKSDFPRLFEDALAAVLEIARGSGPDAFAAQAILREHDEIQ